MFNNHTRERIAEKISATNIRIYNIMKNRIFANLALSLATQKRFADESAEKIIMAVGWLEETFKQGGKLLIFGNGGSAADAQHLAAEFTNRFLLDRRPLPALALTTDSSAITAIANDFSFEQIFSKQITALGKPEDLALGISTSGNSANVVKAIEVARKMGMRTVALTGGVTNPGGKLTEISELVLNVPSDFTPHIQESHLWVEHLLCELVETTMFS
jgi:D-sedoheptulose 7-phosphate isomerase